jgi:hypothetical protein
MSKRSFRHWSVVAVEGGPTARRMSLFWISLNFCVRTVELTVFCHFVVEYELGMVQLNGTVGGESVQDASQRCAWNVSTPPFFKTETSGG